MKLYDRMTRDELLREIKTLLREEDAGRDDGESGEGTDLHGGALHDYQYFRDLAESIPHLVWSARPDGVSDYYNARFLDYLGMSWQEMQGWTWASTLHPDDRQRSIEAWTEAFTKGTEYRIEYRIRRASDGKYRWHEGRALPLRDADGNILRWFGTCTDIQERKHAEEALCQANERLALAQSAGKAGAWDWDPTNDHIEWSSQLFELFGLDPEKTVASFEAWKAILHPEDREIAVSRVAKALRERTSLVNEYRIVRPDGRICWISALGQGTYDAQGRPVRMTGICVDITGRKQSEEELLRSHEILETKVRERTEELARTIDSLQEEIVERKHIEKELRESEERYRSIFNHSIDGILLATPEGKILAANPEACRIFGRTEEELRQVGREGVVDVSDPRIQRFVEERARTGKARGEFSCIRKDGIRFPCDLTSVIFSEKEHIRTSIIVRDITSRKNAEEELRRSEKKFRELFEESKDVILIIDAEGKLHDINPAGTDLFGYTKDELLAMPNSDLLYCDHEERSRFRQELLARGYVKDYEVRMGKKGGEVLHVLIAASTIFDEQHEIAGCRVIIHDITERKLLQQQLMQAQKLESIGLLAGGVAHDFNNLITGILGYAQIIKDHYSAKDELLQTCSGEILSAGERAANLTRNLLAFSSRQVINPKPVSVNDIVMDIIKLMTQIIGEDIELSTSLSHKTLTIMADSGQIEQILINLAANARDAMPGGGQLQIKTSQAVINEAEAESWGLIKGKKYALISVADTGTGIDEKTRERIFEPFFTTKQLGKGTGLGLSIIYGIVKQHEGAVTVESEPGKGTTFSIYLPLIDGSASKDQGREEPSPPGGRETVLIAEDDPVVRKYLEKILVMAGYTVITAQDGEEATIKFAENRHIALVLCDVVMPKKNGREVCQEIRTMVPQAKVLFISGYNDEIIHDKGILHEDIDFLMKPVSRYNVLKKMRDVLDS